MVKVLSTTKLKYQQVYEGFVFLALELDTQGSYKTDRVPGTTVLTSNSGKIAVIANN